MCFGSTLKNETDLGVLAKSFMDKGELVPDQVTIDMLSAEVAKNIDSNGFIFDDSQEMLYKRTR